jgi:hypothetical protein
VRIRANPNPENKKDVVKRLKKMLLTKQNHLQKLEDFQKFYKSKSATQVSSDNELGIKKHSEK